MKRIVLSIAVLGMLAVFNAPATASDFSVFLRGLSHNGHYVAQQNHNRHHDDLGHRAYHRELQHNAAHRYPMSYRQHNGLHDSLNHEAYHDNLEHRSAHRTRAYRPSYGNAYGNSYGNSYGNAYGNSYGNSCRYGQSSNRYGHSRYSPRSGISFSLGY